MATQVEPGREPRMPLTRDRVVRAAITLADEAGLESLSMRRLGQELGVEAMSLYNHIANKDDLLDGIADVVVSEIEVPSGGAEWKSAMRRRAISAREVFGRHPWAIGLFESRTTPSPARLDYPEAVVGCLREAGFSPAMAIHAFNALDSYIYGFAIQEKSFGFPRSEEEFAGVAEATLAQLPADKYPYLREVITEYIQKGVFDYGKEFEFGLDLLLDALETLRSPTPPRVRNGRSPSGAAARTGRSRRRSEA
jgi:AcrR family transcriptional regulator